MTEPDVATSTKVRRVAAGKIGVGGRGERVGEGIIVGGIIVGVTCAWIASIVAATTVSTSLSAGDGAAEFVLLQAEMTTNIAIKTMNGFQRIRVLSTSFIRDLHLENKLFKNKALIRQ